MHRHIERYEKNFRYLYNNRMLQVTLNTLLKNRNYLKKGNKYCAWNSKFR